MADEFDDSDLPDPSLKNIVEQESLQWVFVGGKGCVGKTTTSCCLGTQLAKTRKKVCLCSILQVQYNMLLLGTVHCTSSFFPPFSAADRPFSCQSCVHFLFSHPVSCFFLCPYISGFHFHPFHSITIIYRF